MIIKPNPDQKNCNEFPLRTFDTLTTTKDVINFGTGIILSTHVETETIESLISDCNIIFRRRKIKFPTIGFQLSPWQEPAKQSAFLTQLMQQQVYKSFLLAFIPALFTVSRLLFTMPGESSTTFRFGEETIRSHQIKIEKLPSGQSKVVLENQYSKYFLLEHRLLAKRFFSPGGKIHEVLTLCPELKAFKIEQIEINDPKLEQLLIAKFHSTPISLLMDYLPVYKSADFVYTTIISIIKTCLSKYEPIIGIAQQLYDSLLEYFPQQSLDQLNTFIAIDIIAFMSYRIISTLLSPSHRNEFALQYSMAILNRTLSENPSDSFCLTFKTPVHKILLFLLSVSMANTLNETFDDALSCSLTRDKHTGQSRASRYHFSEAIINSLDINPSAPQALIITRTCQAILWSKIYHKFMRSRKTGLRYEAYNGPIDRFLYKPQNPNSSYYYPVIYDRWLASLQGYAAREACQQAIAARFITSFTRDVELSTLDPTLFRERFYYSMIGAVLKVCPSIEPHEVFCDPKYLLVPVVV